MPSLNWIGRKAIERYHLQVPFRLLGRDESLSVGNANTNNLLIHSDNLLALKSLLPFYARGIRCIYIDPPYNTGKENWIYNDNVNSPEIREWLEHVVGKEGEDLSRHDKWLCMMYPRLALAKMLLSDDGVIFISIDDFELPSLRLLMDELFRPQNMLACFVWQTEGNFDNQAKVKIAHEYILAYAKNLDKFPPPPVIDPTIPKDSKLYRENIQNTIVKNGPGNPVSEVILPRGFPASFEKGTIQKRNDLWPHYATDAVVANYSLQNEVVVSSGWSSKRIFLRFVESGFKPVKDTKDQDTTFVLTRTGAIEAIKKRSEDQSHVISVLRNVGTTQQMSVDLARVGVKFDYPKPIGLIKYLIRMVKGSSFSVLDFFAGSGTTARAVLEINKEEPTRQLNFILVEIKEDIVSICLKHLRSVMRDNEGLAVCRLGSGLFGPSGRIAGDVSYAQLAQHIFFVETGEPMVRHSAGKSPLLGVSQGVAVYLLYNGILRDKSPDGGNALTRSVLERLPEYNGAKVIYGTSCRLGEERLRAEAITFKQIPYAIKTE